MSKKVLSIPLWQWLAMLSLCLLFVSMPQIDIYISSLFFRDRFIGNGTLIETLLYDSVKPLLILSFVGAIVLWLYNRYIAKENLLGFTGRKLIFVLLSLLIGAGLIVNAILKENLGRARPAQTTIFEGTLPFTPAFIPTQHDGYSFTSGHAAAAFSLLAFAYLARRHRAFWISLVISYGSAVGVARISAGGHFFSDVVVSFFIVYIVTTILYNKVLKDEM